MSSPPQSTRAPHAPLDPAGQAAWADLARDNKVAGKKPATAAALLLTLQQLAASSPGTPILEMTRDQASSYLISLTEDYHQAPATVDTRHRHLSRFYRWALEEELITRSPMTRIPAPRLGEHLVPVLTDDQLRALLKTTAGKGFYQQRDAAVLRLLCEAGTPRASELCGITTPDLDMGADQVLLHGKGARDRLIPFGAHTGRALSKYLRARAAHPGAAGTALVFLGQHGPLTRSGLLQMVRKRGMQAGIAGLYPHMLRHTSYHRFDAAGGNPGTARTLFGWSSDRMTNVYGASARARRALDLGRAVAIGDTL